jgi:hypothetical protein
MADTMYWPFSFVLKYCFVNERRGPGIVFYVYVMTKTKCYETGTKTGFGTKT